MDRLPPLNALRAFEAAARLMSFSRAADELAVTPAAVSHQIRALEEDLGTRLFRRLNRALELTDSGRLLLPDLAEAFGRIQAGVGRLRRHNATGTLTVTTSPSFAAKWLVLRLHRFAERHPEIDVRVTASDTVVDLASGDVDIAIRYGAGRYPGLEVELLLENEVFPVCSPALPTGDPPLRTAEDLRRHALLHDITVEIDPLVPTWSMWLKAPRPSTGCASATRTWRSTRRSRAAASPSPTRRSPRATSPPAAWSGRSHWACATISRSTSSRRRARSSAAR
jgi:LysR family glycine cleavage system transcriptional activator